MVHTGRIGWRMRKSKPEPTPRTNLPRRLRRCLVTNWDGIHEEIATAEHVANVKNLLEAVHAWRVREGHGRRFLVEKLVPVSNTFAEFYIEDGMSLVRDLYTL
jgi:hypothetical protein